MKGELHWKEQPAGAQTGMAFAGAWQTVPHLPQFDVAFEVSTQAPSHWVKVPQSAPQMPDLQTDPASHGVVQVPQCSESDFKSTHIPSQGV